MAQAAIYARISPTPGEGAGWQRQLADCKELIAERRWTLAGEYVDRDTSAYRRKRRPEWERLLADLDGGRIDALVVYHPDRAYRRGEALERLIDIVEHRGIEIATVRAGDLDLSTATGRMSARIVAAVTQHESERMGERVARAKLERATEGRPAGGGRRPAGLTVRRDALVPAEAAYLRDVARNILTGASWHAEVRRINDAGHRSPAGNPWTIGTLRRTLTSPHMAGLRAYKGKIVGEATWPAVLDRDVWEALRSGTAQRKRGRPPSDRHLLTGLLICERCNRPLYANTPVSGAWVYRCPPSQATTGKGCGRTIVGGPVDQHVLATVTEWLGHPEFIAALGAHLSEGQEDGVTRAELDEVEAHIAHLDTLHTDGVLHDIDHQSAKRPWIERREQILAALANPYAGTSLDPAVFPAAWAGAIEANDLPEIRALIAMLAELIMVRPFLGPDGHRRSIPERLDLQPRFRV